MGAVGTLRWHAAGVMQPRPVWELSALPHVMIRVKRIFPRVATTTSGAVHIVDTPDAAADLDWLNARHHLDMDDDTAGRLAGRVTEHAARVTAIDDLMAGRTALALEMEPSRTPREYQLVGAQMARTTGRMILGDDVGTGKTTTGSLLLGDPDALPALVVCPPHLQRQWVRELREVWPLLRSHIVTRGRPYDLASVRGSGGSAPDVLVISYSKLAGWEDTLAGQFPTVIFDEVHDLRAGTETKKGTAAARIADSARTVLGMTATAVVNYGDEVHNLYSIVHPDALGSRAEFLREWGGRQVGGHSTIADPAALGSYLREQGLFLRRTRRDVGRELPDATPIRHEVDSDPAALDEVSRDVAAMARMILDSSVGHDQRFITAGQFDLKLRQATGIAKAPYVAEFVRLLLESEERVVLFGWHRACFAAGTRAIMFDGSVRNIEDVEVGDEVMGPDSTVRTVRSLVRGTGKMFRIVPNKGEPWVCSEHHILTVRCEWSGRYEKWTAGEFAARSERWRRSRLLYRADEVTFPGGRSVVEPWLVGYWLGDGATSLRDLRVISADPEIDDEVERIADRWDLGVSRWAAPGVTGTSEARQLAFTSGTRGPKNRNRLVGHFRSLGLDGNKHIPREYLTAPAGDRRELLAGLIDSDGHVYRGNGVGSADYSTIIEGLANDVAFLARSLGLAAYVRHITRDSHTGYGTGPRSIYRVTISGDLTELPTRITRKRPEPRAGQKNVLHTGFRIEEAGTDDYYGFELDGDHLFLLDDFTVVHNCYDVWLDRLAEYNPVLYTGSESPTQKQAAVGRFTSGESRILIISLRSGAGLDGLQHVARTCVFGELDWSPAVHHQAIGRLNRDGQQHPVAAYFPISTVGADPTMEEVLQLKEGQARPINDPDDPLFEPTPDAALDRVQQLARNILASTATRQEHAA